MSTSHTVTRHRFIAGAVVLVAVAACARGTRTVPPGPLTGTARNAHAFVDSLRGAQAIPGMAATVADRKGTVWSGGFGLADRDRGISATPETRFRIGSVSKLLTAALLMRLVETGVLHLDTPVSAYLDPYPAHWPALTLRQLAGHTAGVRHYRGAEFFTREEYRSLRHAMDIFSADTLLFTPGTRYAYTSYGYNLIGAVMEAATGEAFPALMRRLVVAPLAMTGTVPDSADAAVPSRAALYSVDQGEVSATPRDNLSSRWPSGGYLSTTTDLARFGRALLEPGFLSAASLDLMLTIQRLSGGEATQVGIGWRIGVDAAGRRYAHHGGSSNGGSAFLLIYPDQGVTVAMAGNALGTWSTSEALQFASLFLP